MKKWILYPSKAQIVARLDARFGQPDSVSIAQAKAQLQDVAALDWTQEAGRQRALGEMRAVVAVLESAHSDARVAYLRAATDLQVAKVSSLLAYCAIVAAFATALYEKVASLVWPSRLCVVSAGICVLAALATLVVIWSSTPDDAQFKDAKNESHWLEGLLWRRGLLSNYAVFFSAVATISLVVALGLFLNLPAPATDGAQPEVAAGVTAKPVESPASARR